MKNYKIKITGSGSIDQLRTALDWLSTSLSDVDGSRTFEDHILFTELTEDGEVDETPPGDKRFLLSDESNNHTVEYTLIGLRDNFDIMDMELDELEHLAIGEEYNPEYNSLVFIKRII